MIKYIKSFKDFIPTWVICIFMFFGVFLWPLAIAVVLMIIQYFQRKNYNKKMLKILSECSEQKEIEADVFLKNENDELKAKVTNLECKKIELEKSLKSANDSAWNLKLELEREIDNKIIPVEYKVKQAEKMNEYKREIEAVKQELAIINNELVEKYYVFSDYSSITSEECKNKLYMLKIKEKEFTHNSIQINNISDDKKLLERNARKILRNFNAECDNIIFDIGIKNIDICRNKVLKSFETLNKLYSTEGVLIPKALLELKLEQVTLMYTYELKYQQEKEIQKAIKEQMQEEAKAQKEIEEQRKKIEKDLQQHVTEVNRLMKYLQKAQNDVEKQLYIDKIQELEAKIKLLEDDKKEVAEREANAKAGFVYIISNIGSFGENIFKIGMTRRLEPMERIRELSSASVPFEFDVHAMIFSSDAPELENTLHKHFADKAVNKVNPRKKFFNVSIDEIEKVVKKNYNDTVQFTKIPLATEYRQSINM